MIHQQQQRPIQSLKDVQKYLQRKKEEEEEMLSEEEELEKEFNEYMLVAQNVLKIQHVPIDILRKIQSVLGKHSIKDVRMWGSNLMSTYNLLWNIEKPMNLSTVKHFSNTKDFVKKTPRILKHL